MTLAYAYAPRDARRPWIQAGVCLALLVLLVVCVGAKVDELT